MSPKSPKNRRRRAQVSARPPAQPKPHQVDDLAQRLEEQVLRLPLTALSPLGAVTAASAIEQVQLAAAVARAGDQGLVLAVRFARDHGASWADVGQALGVSRQAAWERYGRRRGPAQPQQVA